MTLTEPEAVEHGPAWDQEFKLIEELRIISNPKKLVREAFRISNSDKYTPIQKLLASKLVEHSKPKLLLKSYENRIRDFAILMENFIEDGAHGLIMTGEEGNSVYPLKLDVRENWISDPDDRWNLEDETEIIEKALDAYLLEHPENSRFSIKAVLFPQFGFSGVPRQLQDPSGRLKELLDKNK